MGRKYNLNSGLRDQPIRVGTEAGLYAFVTDYAKDMGMSMSGAARRLMILGARCEAEHGKVRMPSSYTNLEMPNSMLDYFRDDDEPQQAEAKKFGDSEYD